MNPTIPLALSIKVVQHCVAHDDDDDDGELIAKKTLNTYYDRGCSFLGDQNPKNHFLNKRYKLEAFSYKIG